MVRNIRKFLKGRWKLIFSICTLIAVGLVATRLIYLHWFGSIVWLPFTGLEDKTLWNLAELLIIPVTLSGVAAILERFERKTDREIAENRAILDREIANQRADLDREAANKRAEVDREIAEERSKVDRDIAIDNQRETALQNYFDAITNLILKDKLRESLPSDVIRDIARVKTTTTIERLDNYRKSKLVRFLYDVGLVLKIGDDNPIISLECANLSNSLLDGAILKGTILTRSNLERASLNGAFFGDANLMESNIKEASLKMAHLWGTNLEGAILEGTDLTDATYNKDTKWPAGFDPVAAGAIRVDE